MGSRPTLLQPEDQRPTARSIRSSAASGQIMHLRKGLYSASSDGRVHRRGRDGAATAAARAGDGTGVATGGPSDRVRERGERTPATAGGGGRTPSPPQAGRCDGGRGRGGVRVGSAPDSDGGDGRVGAAPRRGGAPAGHHDRCGDRGAGRGRSGRPSPRAWWVVDGPSGAASWATTTDGAGSRHTHTGTGVGHLGRTARQSPPPPERPRGQIGRAHV